MIDKQKALDFLDRGFEERMGALFSVLATGLATGNRDKALEAFRTGFENLRTAHEQSTAIVEKSFAA